MSEEVKSKVGAFLQKERERDREWSVKFSAEIARLTTKLLGIGGTRISPQPETWIEHILNFGRLQDYPAKMKRGEPCRCHQNAARMWLRGTPKSLAAIGTGYALTEDDGMWRPHSWLIHRTRTGHGIIETTVLRKCYFGLAIQGEGARKWAELMMGEEAAQCHR